MRSRRLSQAVIRPAECCRSAVGCAKRSVGVGCALNRQRLFGCPSPREALGKTGEQSYSRTRTFAQTINPPRGHMEGKYDRIQASTQNTELTSQLFGIMRRKKECNIEELVEECGSYPWEQVLLEVV